jgi:hypothetical protein
MSGFKIFGRITLIISIYLLALVTFKNIYRDINISPYLMATGFSGGVALALWLYITYYAARCVQKEIYVAKQNEKP